MKAACIAAVEKALGRDLGPGEAKGIEDRVRKWMRLLARTNEDWTALSRTQRLNAASKAAANELIRDVVKARQQVSLQIAAWDRDENLLHDMPIDTLQNYLDRMMAISRTLAFDPGKSGPRSIESSAKAMGEEMRGALMDAWKVAHPKFFGLFESQQGINDLIDEIYGKDTGNAAAKAGAKAWRDTMDKARDRINAAGGHVGTLGEQYFPNSHDKFKVGNAGFDKWYGFIRPLLDMSRYLNPDGTQLSDRDLRDFFSHAFDTIHTDGDAKAFKSPRQGEMIGPELMQQRASGYGLFADRNSQHRQIFFKDGEAFRSYQAKFGRQSFLSAMLEHVNRFARDTAVLENKGPWADQQFHALNDREYQQATLKFTDEKSKAALAQAHDFNNRLWDFVTGQRDIVDSRISRFFQGYRNLMTGLRLGKVVITALGDEAGMFATAFANGVPYSEMLMNQLRVLQPFDHDTRSAMESLGVGLNSMIGSINRYGAEDMGRGATGKFANFIMRVTGAERLWDSRRQAVALTLMHQIGKLSRSIESVSGLHDSDAKMLARKGIDEKTWQVYRRAGLNADGAVTPHEIWSIPDEKLKDLGDPLTLKRNATTALGAHIWEEAGMGVMETGARQQARVSQIFDKFGLDSMGPIARTFMLFKTFSSSMVMKHWARMASLNTLQSKAAYGTILAVYGTAIAAAGNQIRALLAGQNPKDMTKGRFMLEAALRGGGLGFYGDFMYDQLNSRDQSLGDAAVGPMGTDLKDIWNVTGGAAFKSMKGERTDEGAHLIRFARDNNPLLNVWYTSALWDHWLWYNAQEAANPGYLDRMMNRQSQYGRNFWWDPHDMTPQNGPDFGKAVGNP